MNSVVFWGETDANYSLNELLDSISSFIHDFKSEIDVLLSYLLYVTHTHTHSSSPFLTYLLSENDGKCPIFQATHPCEENHILPTFQSAVLWKLVWDKGSGIQRQPFRDHAHLRSPLPPPTCSPVFGPCFFSCSHVRTGQARGPESSPAQKEGTVGPFELKSWWGLQGKDKILMYTFKLQKPFS